MSAVRPEESRASMSICPSSSVLSFARSPACAACLSAVLESIRAAPVERALRCDGAGAAAARDWFCKARCSGGAPDPTLSASIPPAESAGARELGAGTELAAATEAEGAASSVYFLGGAKLRRAAAGDGGAEVSGAAVS
jgi:hypothetical protein